jgi:hypothetical protein
MIRSTPALLLIVPSQNSIRADSLVVSIALTIQA